MHQTADPVPAADVLAPNLMPDQLPMPRPVDPGSLLGFRTPLPEHTASADGKAAALLTLLGIMFTILARYSTHLGLLLPNHYRLGGWFTVALLAAFGGLALATLVQAFRTLMPRFVKAPPSLAFFGDIARLSREEYVQRVEAISANDALAQILNYNYTNSLIIIEKFKQLRRGLRFFQGAFFAWVILMAVVLTRVLWMS